MAVTTSGGTGGASPNASVTLTPDPNAPYTCVALANKLMDKVIGGDITPAQAEQIFTRAGCYEAVPGAPKGNLFTTLGKIIVGGGEAAVSLPHFLGMITTLKFWIRTGEILGGVILAILALKILSQQTGVLK